MNDAAVDTDGSVYEDEGASMSDAEPTKSEPIKSKPKKSEKQPKTDSAASKKRKRRFDAGDGRARRYRKIYSHGYRDLYNADVEDAVDFLPVKKHGRPPPSQIGASFWTTAEKQRLFSALERYGRGQIQQLTSAIQTKSEPQVREYLLLLQQGAVEVFLNDKRFDYKPIRLFEIPAAHEISEECCKKLDATSKALSWHQYSFEARQEQEKHGEFWLLTPAIAEQVKEAFPEAAPTPTKKKRWDRYEVYQPEKDSDQELDQEEEDLDANAKALLKSIPAASLLDLPKWIKLSHNVFMNAGGDRADENWRSIVEENDELGIFNTAFSDFHRLAVSVTKRLVAAALNQATSRLRATDRNYDHAAKPSVSTRDVNTALDILNMPRSAKKVWTNIPARCGVQVYTQGKNGAVARYLDYDEVERELGGNPIPTRPQKQKRGEDFVDDVKDDAYKVDGSGAAKEGGEDSDDNNKGNKNKSDTEDEDAKEAAEVQEYEEQMDAYAEDHDMLQSQLEEARMWETLDLPTPEVPQKELGKRPRKPKFATDVDDLLDWRELVDYKAPWERFGRPITEAAFEKTQRSLIDPPAGPSRVLPRKQMTANEALANDAPPERQEIEIEGDQARYFPVQSASETRQEDQVPEENHTHAPTKEPQQAEEAAT
ncbi:hypothetical protein HDK77DRAFT_55582, partial [Phyllosticta capitalensis]|uniref:uncharacterized protein n=1 Tax=Phyllosticta capitalensis TaxID=121624 RepID=UPI00312DCEDF